MTAITHSGAGHRGDCIRSKRTAETQWLPVTAGAVRDLLGLLSLPPWHLSELIDLILGEPALTAHAFRVAGERAGEPQVSLEECVILLGAAGLRSLAMELPIVEQHDPVGTVFYGLLQHARRCARLTEYVATACGWPIPKQGLLAGLLHDVGRMKQIWQATGLGLVPPAPNTPANAEARVESARIAEFWHFPTAVAESLRHVLGRGQEGRAGVLGRALALGNAVAEYVEGMGKLALSEEQGRYCLELIQQHLTATPGTQFDSLAETLVREARWDTQRERRYNGRENQYEQ